MTTRSKSRKDNSSQDYETLIKDMYVIKDADPGIVKHHKATGHNFDWKNFKLLDHEPYLY